MITSAALQRSFSKLTENDVKQRFVPFLKDFYRQRYEPIHGSEAVEMDNVSAGGVVADGKLSFRKSDGSPFLCTYEATSLDKAEEVKYRLNIHYFIWDCIAFSSLFTAIFYIFFYVTKRPWLYTLQVAGNIGLLIGLFFIGFFAWYFSMQKWRKYRFIHAIAQFKQYYADEQWIALAEDVFPSPVDPYLLELRDQCVYNGFGLAIVSGEQAVRVLVAPSRLGVYGKDRKLAHWVTRAEWYQQMSSVAKVNVRPPDQMTVLWNRMTRPLHYLVSDPLKRMFSRAFGQNTDAYTRFMEGQAIQKWMTGLSLLLLSPLFYKVITFRTMDAADLKALQDWRSKDNPEDEFGYKIDGEAIPYNAIPPGVPKQYPVRADEEDEVQEINLSGDDDEEITDAPQPKKQAPRPAVVKPKETPKQAKTTTQSKTKTSAPCAKLQGKKGWIVQDNVFSSAENARSRVKSLLARGIAADWIGQECIAQDAEGYVVWIGPVHGTQSKAQAQADVLSKTIKAANLGRGRLLVRTIKN